MTVAAMIPVSRNSVNAPALADELGTGIRVRQLPRALFRRKMRP
jgi:hypothetical protein